MNLKVDEASPIPSAAEKAYFSCEKIRGIV